MFLTAAIASAALAMSQAKPEVIPLWPNGAPGSEARKNEPEEAEAWWVRNIHNPSLTVYKPEAGKANGCAIIVVPGGGHHTVNFPVEGTDPAVYLNKLGVTVFALKYRLAREDNSKYSLENDVRADAFRAVRLVRSNAAKYGLDPNRIGMMGFSAGGEVVHYVAFGDPEWGDKKDEVDKIPATLSFAVLIYPGPIGAPVHVHKLCPPLFMLVSSDDWLAPVCSDTLQKYLAAGVSVEAHFLAKGGHGYNMGQRSDLKSVKTWPDRLADWLSDNGWLKEKAAG